jgi:hypothetical protein
LSFCPQLKGVYSIPIIPIYLPYYDLATITTPLYLLHRMQYILNPVYSPARGTFPRTGQRKSWFGLDKTLPPNPKNR